MYVQHGHGEASLTSLRPATPYLTYSFIMGLHVLAGSVALNTLSNHATCTLVFGVAMTAVMFLLSLVRGG